jgi:hypothetical protein
MSKVQIIAGTTADDFPPLGSIGEATSISGNQVIFIPDNLEHYPPDTPVDEFEGYVFEAHEVENLE